MKKTWKKPGLEVLEVKMTFGGTDYNDFDADYQDNTQIPLDENGMPLIGKS